MRKQKKLTLNLETLRQLDSDELLLPVGGCTVNTLTQYVTCTRNNSVCRCP